MKANTLFKSCLLACSVLAGAQAFAGPGTVNSIQFSFMNYSSTAPQSFSTLPLTSFDSTPAPSVSPISTPTPQEIQPVVEVYLPSTNVQIEAPQIIAVDDLPQAAAAVPEPGTIALLGLGCALLLLRRREGFHA
ncbi:PEP-CTERM sorting domain-containing protein [Duganella sp. Root1480D1]|uniref:PEP-CTERM sorting domain-containing protein n=1 Tax=Duganella sp. Root1480D1 TaxID=1736471 RepID=UPI000A8B1269|nr:PEP-CTERM sorting domain-containing protein [Duganella sp. Root1480D1]